MPLQRQHRDEQRAALRREVLVEDAWTEAAPVLQPHETLCSSPILDMAAGIGLGALPAGLYVAAIANRWLFDVGGWSSALILFGATIAFFFVLGDFRTLRKTLMVVMSLYLVPLALLGMLFMVAYVSPPMAGLLTVRPGAVNLYQALFGAGLTVGFGGLAAALLRTAFRRGEERR